eukprot:m.44293 g.44293  ORF g.44293 m.44293 type:complete len:247 (+) comp14539_c0_seq1:108-848(+)
MTDPAEWYRNIPTVTKFWFTGCAVTTLAGNFGAVSPFMLVFSWPAIWHGFQIWRLVTCALFMGKLGFPFLINLYFLYSYSNMLETGLYDGRTADYVFLVFFCWLVLVFIAFLFDIMMIGVPLIIAVLYVWCAVNADQIVSFWFGTRFKARFLPWVLLGFNVLLGGSGIMELLGILAGHAFFFLKYQWPAEHGGNDWIPTPSFLKRWLPDRGPTVAGFGVAPEGRRPPPQEVRRDWGQGRRLGGADE